MSPHNRGVQAADPVTVHSGAFEIRRPGSWNKALFNACPSDPIRLVRYLVSAMVTPALTARSLIGWVNASSSKPWLRTPPRVWPDVQAPVSGLLSVSAPLRLVLQLLMLTT